ncbi:MAG: flagellar basal-body rod protein FlgF [Rhodospirillales bacterium]
MENTLYIALSHQMAAQRNVEVLANNLANATSPGFKGDSLMFTEYVEKAGRGQPISFVRDRAVFHNLTEGSLKRTDNELDVAINGRGWFTVGSNGGELYTRNGHFHLNQQGQIVTSRGEPVLGENNQPIVIGAEDANVTIASDGTVSAGAEVRGKLKIVGFANEQDLRNVSGGLFRAPAPGEPIAAPTLVQGSLEESNVQPIVEMTRMMDAVRTYQQAQKMIDVEHERQRKAIDRLMKTN